MRGAANQIVKAVYGVHSARRGGESPRNYLGASSLGNPCRRALWYDFRHASTPDFEGRILRLFNTGHREEARLIAELREVLDRDPKTKRQFEVKEFGGHFSGHMDGLIEVDGRWMVFEAKTSATKAFKRVKKEGVEKAKPVHFAQMQVYLGFSRMQWEQWGVGGEAPEAALYMMVCKETDALYAEVVPFDEQAFEDLMWKARDIIDALEPPEKLREDPSYYLCNWCRHHAICHASEAPNLDCRTCLHSTTDRDGSWLCGRFKDMPIPSEHLSKGCTEHLFIPPLLGPRHGPIESYEGQLEFPVDPPRWVKYADGTINSAEGLGQGLSSAALVELTPPTLPKVC